MEKVYRVSGYGYDEDYDLVEWEGPCAFRDREDADLWVSRHKDLANNLADFYREKLEEISVGNKWDKVTNTKYKIWGEKYWHWHVRCVRWYIHELELR